MANAAEKKDIPQNTPPTKGAPGAEDPTMEEILRSIRGVISGEESEPTDDDVLELTDMVEEAPESMDAQPKQDGEVTDGTDGKSVLDQIDEAIGTNEPQPEPEPEPTPEPEPVVEEKKPEPAAVTAPEPEPEPEPELADTESVSEQAFSAQVQSLSSLITEQVADESTETLKALVNNIPRPHVTSPYTHGGTTLEQLTIEAMKPFLAEWLNKNLPIIVRQIVAKEIKKLIPEEDYK